MSLYQTKPWREFRAEVLSDCSECYLSGLAGDCYGRLHVHHNLPLSEGGEAFPPRDGVTVLCHRHHRMVHGMRNRSKRWKTCSHNHRYRWARDLCEQRLNAA